MAARAAMEARDAKQPLLWVVRLGGSLIGSPQLKRWLAVLGDAGGRAVLVPGGGPFADQVRVAQTRFRFNDVTAHRMALLAMEQYGCMLAGLHPGLRLAGSAREIAQARRSAQTAVWLPTRMVLADPGVAASWDITSDSLAAWLAGKLDADRLLLVKSVTVPDESVSALTLARRGIVDPAFPDYLLRSGSEGWCIDAAGHAELARALRAADGCGTRITARARSIAGRRGRANIAGRPRPDAEAMTGATERWRRRSAHRASLGR